MTFSREEAKLLHGAELDGALRSVGMRIGAGTARGDADIELTLASAAEDAVPHDYRLFGVLAAWLQTHHARVNVPRLKRIVGRASNHALARAWWSSVGTWLGRDDARWRALTALYEGPVLSLDAPDVTALQLARVGEDERFSGTKLRVHAKLLRSRPADVDAPAALASRHALYRKRIELGPSYRADVWHALEAKPDASVAEIARTVLCAYETARSVANDFWLLRSIAGARSDGRNASARLRLRAR